MPSSPNILIVIADQLVAELTGAYGHPVVRTPNGNDYGKDLLRMHYAQAKH